MTGSEASKHIPIIIDRNSAWYGSAIWQIAIAYSTFNDPPLNPEEVKSELLDDPYSHRARYVGILVNDKNGDNDVHPKLAGVTRVVLGTDNPEIGTCCLEAAELMDVPEFRGKKNFYRLAEFTRFTIVPEFKDDKVGITLGIFTAGCDLILRPSGIEELFAIMPPYMLRIINQAEINVEAVDSQVQANSHIAALREKYPRYWNKNPRLYRFTDYP